MIEMVGKGFDGASNMSGKDKASKITVQKLEQQNQHIFIVLLIDLTLFWKKCSQHQWCIWCIWHNWFCVQIHGRVAEKAQLICNTSGEARSQKGKNCPPFPFFFFPAVVSMFKEMSDQSDSAAESLLTRLKKFPFVLASMVLKKYLRKSMSEYLHHKDIDLVRCVSGIKSLCWLEEG